MPTNPPTLDLVALIKTYWPMLAAAIVAIVAYLRRAQPTPTPATPPTPQQPPQPPTAEPFRPITGTQPTPGFAPAPLDLLRMELHANDFCQALTGLCQAAQPVKATADNASPNLAALTDQLADLQSRIANLLTIARRWWPLLQLLAKLWGVTLPDLPALPTIPTT